MTEKTIVRTEAGHMHLRKTVILTIRLLLQTKHFISFDSIKNIINAQLPEYEHVTRHAVKRTVVQLLGEKEH